ncbi:unnamed protein product [Pleuronectes platessa]|uniref:Uncharacterized protein n=1 Tax=Pleuronectes platessa TaxID=8262 RepID=A0A9N7UJ16_PLEPL|nr:unnamed protein product [Pleuronectes platessa]
MDKNGGILTSCNSKSDTSGECSTFLHWFKVKLVISPLCVTWPQESAALPCSREKGPIGERGAGSRQHTGPRGEVAEEPDKEVSVFCSNALKKKKKENIKHLPEELTCSFTPAEPELVKIPGTWSQVRAEGPGGGPRLPAAGAGPMQLRLELQICGECEWQKQSETDECDLLGSRPMNLEDGEGMECRDVHISSDMLQLHLFSNGVEPMELHRGIK